MKALRADQRVLHPAIPSNPRVTLLQGGRIESEEGRYKTIRRVAGHRAKNFLRFAQGFKVPMSLEDLEAIAEEGKGKKVEKELNAWCNGEGRTRFSTPFSTKIYDKNDKLIFCYLGVWWKDEGAPDASTIAILRTATV